MLKYAITCARQARRGAAEPGDLWDRAGREAGDDLLGKGARFTQAGGAGVDRPQPLVAGPGELDVAVRVAGEQHGLRSGVLAFAQVLEAVPQQTAIS